MNKKLCILTALFVAFSAQLLVAQSITVMSYNIRSSTKNEQDGEHGWVHRKEAAVKMLLAEKPDIVGMQEEMPEMNWPQMGRYMYTARLKTFEEAQEFIRWPAVFFPL